MEELKKIYCECKKQIEKIQEIAVIKRNFMLSRNIRCLHVAIRQCYPLINDLKKCLRDPYLKKLCDMGSEELRKVDTIPDPSVEIDKLDEQLAIAVENHINKCRCQN